MKKTKQEQRSILIEQAKELHAQGFTTREIGTLIGRSHGWVASVVRDFQGFPQENIVKS